MSTAKRRPKQAAKSRMRPKQLGLWSGLKAHWKWGGAVLLASLGLAGMIYQFEQNRYPKGFADYPIQGFDVSRHQGKIAWHKIDPAQHQFVFIKATEGGDYQDANFISNWQQARAQGLKVGGYHFFRNCKSGAEQAANFIATVPKAADSLPPVIDLEFQWQCPEVTAEQLQKQIAIMAQLLQQHYAKRPILYTTPNYYRSYIHAELQQYPLWLQDFKHRPQPHEQRPWLFWQYSQTGKIAGIQTAVDLNIFRGDQAALEQLIHPQAQAAAVKP